MLTNYRGPEVRMVCGESYIQKCLLFIYCLRTLANLNETLSRKWQNEIPGSQESDNT